MTLPTDEPRPTPRPADPFTSQDGARLFMELNKIVDTIKTDIQYIKGALATLQSQNITILEAIARQEAGLATSRFDRLAVEMREAELEKEVAEKNLRAKEEKLEQKQKIADHTIDTQDRFKAVAGSTYEERERAKKETQEAKIADLKFSVLKSVITWGAIGAVGLVFAFIWFLIQLYINRGGP